MCLAGAGDEGGAEETLLRRRDIASLENTHEGAFNVEKFKLYTWDLSSFLYRLHFNKKALALMENLDNRIVKVKTKQEKSELLKHS